MKTFKEFIAEGVVVDLERSLLYRLVIKHHKLFSEKGYIHTTTQKGNKTIFAWRKGRHHFEIQHDSKMPYRYVWGHAEIRPDNGKLRFYNSGNASLRTKEEPKLHLFNKP